MSLRRGEVVTAARDPGATFRLRASAPGAPPSAPPSARPRYEMLVKIGTGGTSSVYIGRLTGAAGFSRLFAIKRLHPHLVGDPSAQQMVFVEGRLASRIHHANVVAVHDVDPRDGEMLLVLDYIEGGTLAELLEGGAARGRPLPPRVATRILLDACEGLAAFHELRGDDERPLGFVHGDVSPHNVLVGLDGTARITDLGLAKLMGDPRSSGALNGKLAYLAPEAIRDARFSVRSDVFALGICAWEAYAGRRLFRGANESDTLRRIGLADAPPLSTIVPSLGAYLDEVIGRALEKAPERRYSSVRELADALARVARDRDLYATSAEVGAYVEAIVGDAVERRRKLVRQHEGEVESDVLYRQTVSMVPPPRVVPIRPLDGTPTLVRVDLRAHLDRLIAKERADVADDPTIEVQEIEVGLDELVLDASDDDGDDPTELFACDPPVVPPLPPRLPEAPPTIPTPPPVMSRPAVRLAPPGPISVAPAAPLPLVARKTARSTELGPRILITTPTSLGPSRELPPVRPPPRVDAPEGAAKPSVPPPSPTPIPPPPKLPTRLAIEPRRETQKTVIVAPPRAASPARRSLFDSAGSILERLEDVDRSRLLRAFLVAVIALEIVLITLVATGVIPRGGMVTTDVAHHELATPGFETSNDRASAPSGHAGAASEGRP